MNNNLEESRKRRREKSKKASIIAIVAVLVIGLVVFASLKMAGKGISMKSNKAKDGQTSEETQPIDRAELEAQRMEKYGKFYVPLPEGEVKKEDFKARALYLNQETATYGFSEENIAHYEEYIKYEKGEIDQDPGDMDFVNPLERILAICNQTEINALVINIKNDDGNITWKSDIEAVKELGTDVQASADDYQALLAYMEKHDIYPIARIVVFKDHILPELVPEHGMKLKEGGLYYDDSGTAWVDQYDKFVWDYVISISKETALRGFKEIHFDYIRFPDDSETYNKIVDFSHTNGVRKDENIQNFIDYAMEELEPYGVEVAAAVFGIITRSWEDYPDDIGQTWLKVTDEVDIISPMVYPSHYGTGWYDYEFPDAEPYGVFKHSMMEAIEKNASVENPAKIRPWIQGFTAPWVDGHIEYTPEVIAEQIKACVELGIDEYLVWNAGNDYDPLAFTYLSSFKENPRLDPEDLPEMNMDQVDTEREGGKPAFTDLIGNSPYTILREYLFAMHDLNEVSAYLSLNPKARVKTVKEFEANFGPENALYAPSVNQVKLVDGSYVFDVEAAFIIDGDHYLGDVQYKVDLVNGVFKVTPPELDPKKLSPIEAPVETEAQSEAEDISEYIETEDIIEEESEEDL